MIFPQIAVLAGFTLFSFGLIFAGSRKINDPAVFAVLRAKYFTTLVVMAAIVGPILAGQLVFFLSVTLFALLSQNEVMRLGAPHLAWPWRIPALAGMVLILLLSFAFGLEGLMAGLILVVALFLLVHCYFPGQEGMWGVYGQTLACLLYPGVFWAFYLMIWHLPGGPALILFFYIVTEANNAFAQMIGSMAGKRKIFPLISPNKTWEGVVGGAVTALISGVLLTHLAFDFDLTMALVVSGLIIVGATAGDLIASGIKRRFQVKDFGRVLPNHGGIMDILDSTIFTAPFFYWFAASFLGGTG